MEPELENNADAEDAEAVFEMEDMETEPKAEVLEQALETTPEVPVLPVVQEVAALADIGVENEILETEPVVEPETAVVETEPEEKTETVTVETPTEITAEVGIVENELAAEPTPEPNAAIIEAIETKTTLPDLEVPDKPAVVVEEDTEPAIIEPEIIETEREENPFEAEIESLDEMEIPEPNTFGESDSFELLENENVNSLEEIKMSDECSPRDLPTVFENEAAYPGKLVKGSVMIHIC